MSYTEKEELARHLAHGLFCKAVKELVSLEVSEAALDLENTGAQPCGRSDLPPSEHDRLWDRGFHENLWTEVAARSMRFLSCLEGYDPVLTLSQSQFNEV